MPDPQGGPDPLTAVYLVPFHRAELSLVGQVRRLLNAEDDRMPSFRDVDWDKALAWLATRTGPRSPPSSGTRSGSR